MAVHSTKSQIPAFVVNGQLFDIVSTPADLINFRIALRSWFMAYLTQTDTHINHSPLSENIWFYEVLQEWLDSMNTATVATSTLSNPL